MSAIRHAIAVEKRTVYAFGKRKRTVYDARGSIGGIEYNVMGATPPAEARALAMRDVEYVCNAGAKVAAGCAVRPSGFQCWEFSLPRGVIMSYGAATLDDAIARIVDAYSDHPDAQDFIAAVSKR